mmetsp:Transcript_90320/g.254939  ORF Transcript_90320/g.254939 Transcript_90320/m.254939 type:complete len:338 (+) Transcript_90320:96-1109(+)
MQRDRKHHGSATTYAVKTRMVYGSCQPSNTGNSGCSRRSPSRPRKCHAHRKTPRRGTPPDTSPTLSSALAFPFAFAFALGLDPLAFALDFALPLALALLLDVSPICAASPPLLRPATALVESTTAVEGTSLAIGASAMVSVAVGSWGCAADGALSPASVIADTATPQPAIKSDWALLIASPSNSSSPFRRFQGRCPVAVGRRPDPRIEFSCSMAPASPLLLSLPSEFPTSSAACNIGSGMFSSLMSPIACDTEAERLSNLAKTRSSRVSATMRKCTSTSAACWPIRWILASACSMTPGTAGQSSVNTQSDAAVIVRPSPAARTDNTMTRQSASVWKR